MTPRSRSQSTPSRRPRGRAWRWVVLAVTMMIGALLWNGPVAELFISCDDDCQDCGDGDRSCHCPPTCPCAPAGAAIPPTSGTELARQRFTDLDAPSWGVIVEPHVDAPLRELLKVPKLLG